MNVRVFGVALLCAAAAAQAQLSKPEQVMVETIDKQAPVAQDFLRELVEINSGTQNLEGVRAVEAKLEPRFKALGFKTQKIDMSAVHRAETLLATHRCPKPNACGKRMLLIGHMDTVFDKASPFQHWSVDGDTATGPGSNDMKGGLVIMLMALDAMQSAGVLKNADITVVLTGDEEAHGEPASISRKPMIDAAMNSDVALEFEGTPRIGDVYYGSIARRSSSSWVLKTTGKTGHSSGIFGEQMGYGAIYEMARILDEFRRQLTEPSLTYNVGTIAGGVRVEDSTEAGGMSTSGKTNIIPAIAEANGDMRTLSDDQTARTQAKMKEIVSHHLPGTGAEISFNEGYPAMEPKDTSRAILRKLNEANKDIGFKEMPELDPLQRGAGDISFVAPYIPGIAGVGATGSGAHAPGETVDLPSQAINAKRDAVLMYRLSLAK